MSVPSDLIIFWFNSVVQWFLIITVRSWDLLEMIFTKLKLYPWIGPKENGDEQVLHLHCLPELDTHHLLEQPADILKKKILSVYIYNYIVKVPASWYTLVFLCSWLHPKIPPKPRWVLQSRWRRMEWKVGISKVTRIWSLHLNFLLKGLSTNWSKIWIQVRIKVGLLFLWAVEIPPLFLVSLILLKMPCFTPSDLLNLMASPKILVFFKLGGT